MKNLGIIGILAGGVALGATLGFAAASRTDRAANSITSSEPLTCSVGGAQATEQSLVEVNGEKFTREKLPQEVRSAIFEIEHESRDKMAWTVKEFALRFALASEKNSKIDLNKIPPMETLLNVPKPDEASMKSVFEAHKSQMPPGTTYEQVRPQIEQHLAGQSSAKVVQAKMAELEKQGKIRVLIPEPIPPVVNLDLEGFPSQGPKNATVTVVEASDYLCSHCQHTQPEVEALLQAYKGRIRFVQVNFALNQSGLSGMLAQGAFCAQRQSDEGFWKFHHEAFAAKQLPNADLKRETLAIAEKAGVKTGAFEKCLGSEDAKSFVAMSVEKLSAIGVTGTPSFFINGRKMGHHASLKESVDAALAETR
jgi:protein-disulfide isomerase